MKVFVTGAAGFIGRAVVQELLNNGHTVLGLARNDENAAILEKLGAEVLRGDLYDKESVAKGAAASDGIIHLAYNHDFNDFEAACATDRAVIQAMADAIQGTGKPFAIAQGTLSLPEGQVNDEDSAPVSEGFFAARPEAEKLIHRLSKEQGISGISVRLAPTVHGKEDKGFMSIFVGMARQKGYVTMIGDGGATWTAVHRLDAAALFRLAIEKARPASTYHAVSESVKMKDVFEVISKKLALPLKSITMEEAEKEGSFVANASALDRPCTSTKTQAELGWKPKQLGLLEDLEQNYF